MRKARRRVAAHVVGRFVSAATRIDDTRAMRRVAAAGAQWQALAFATFEVA
jgi:hypothetical protein